MKVMPKSIVANKTIMDIDKDKRSPRDMVFALILRGKELIPAVGTETFQVDDKVVVLTHHESVPRIEKLFLSKGKAN